MKTWERVLLPPQATLRDAMEVINAAGSQVALVVDERRRLLGLLSDGDIRRALLAGQGIDGAVSEAMFTRPTVARAGDDRLAILATMRSRGLHQLPVVDADNVVVGLEVVDDFLTTPTRPNWVVIMAGGLGSRLKELTRDTPKPMLRIGSRPLLETILLGCAAQGFRRFYLAVNYKAEQIEAYFGDGRAWGIEIHYLKERQRLGTGGALSLLPGKPSLPIVVTNADLLTKEDFAHMVDAHEQSGADATLAVREYEMQVPFGVVREQEGFIEAIDEKPVQRFTVSAGMYVLSPAALELVPRETYFDMPSLFDRLAEHRMRARCHRINGYWLDIGRLPDYERAKLEYADVFDC